MRCVVWYEKGGLRGTGQNVEMLTGCLMPGKSRALETEPGHEPWLYRFLGMPWQPLQILQLASSLSLK